MDTVATYVAIKFGVPSTFFHSSYFGSDAVWANGPSWEQSSLNTFMNRSYPSVIGRLQSPTTFGETAVPSFSKLLKALFLMFWNYLVFFILDLKILKKANAHLFV